LWDFLVNSKHSREPGKYLQYCTANTSPSPDARNNFEENAPFTSEDYNLACRHNARLLKGVKLTPIFLPIGFPAADSVNSSITLQLRTPVKNSQFTILPKLLVIYSSPYWVKQKGLFCGS
jgi:hypothetical protein